MANVKGLVVQIGGDTSGLEKALKSVNSSTKNLSKELKSVNSLLKFDTKNQDLFNQKQKIIQESVKKTREQLETLKKQQDEFVKNGGDVNSDKYRALERKITECKIALHEAREAQEKLIASQSSITNIGKSFETLGGTIEGIGTKISTLGTKMSKLSIASGGILTAGIKSSIDFESAFIGVEKTVEGTEQQLNNLREGIKRMSTEIPSSVEEISAVAEAAGQLGIETDNVLAFTKVMIDLGNSTNLSATEAASSLAKFANITKMSASDYDKLGAAIVDLGNNFATTEADIVNTATNLAATGELTGLTEPQILALATTMSSLGIEAQAGGTAMSKLLKKLQLATELGGKDLEQFSKVAGMTGDEFKKAFEEDATKALGAFVSGLNDTERNGKSAIAILDDMGLTEVRLSNAVLSMANNSDLMNKAIETGNKAWNENTALTKESDKRYASMSSQLTIMKNELRIAGTELVSSLLPAFKSVIDRIKQAVKWFSNLSDGTKSFIAKALVITTALPPVLTIFGKLTTGIGKVVGNVGKLITKVGSLGKVFSVLTSPMGIVIAALTALAGVFIYLYNTNEQFRIKVQTAFQTIITFIQTYVIPIITKVRDLVVAVITTIWNVISNLWSTLEPFITQIFTFLIDWWNNTGSEIMAIVGTLIDWLITAVSWLYSNVIEPIINFLNTLLLPAISFVADAISNIVEGVSFVISAVWGTIKGILNTIITFLENTFGVKWEEIWNGISNFFSGIWDGISNIFKTTINGVLSGLESLVNGAIDALNWLLGGITDIANVVGGAIGLDPIDLRLSHISLPRMAKGGIVDKATLAMIGEGKSSEAVIPLDNTLTKYMAKAIKEAGGVGSTNNDIIVNFYPQQMTEAELEKAFVFINRKFGQAY